MEMNSRLAFRLSTTIKKTALPPIPVARQWAGAYRPRPDRPLLDLSQGAPGIPPPSFLLDAIAQASSKPETCGYGPVTGEPALRQALVEEMKHVYGAKSDLQPDDVAITSGCNMAFMAVIMTLASAGDQVILPVPWYFNHQMSLDMLGIETIPLQTDSSSGFIPDVKDCAKLITEKTRAIALVTPNNPTGAIYPAELLTQFATLADERGIALIIDETYRDLLIDQAPHDLFAESARWNWRKNLIHLFSFSKSYCLPGHRLGAVVANPEALFHIRTVLDCMQVCPPRPAQLALSPLLSTLRPFIRESAKSVLSRQNLFKEVLPHNWKIISQGGYYAWVQHPFKGIESETVSRHLAIDFGIATLPSAFFTPPVTDGTFDENNECIRFSVANVSDEKIRMLAQRLEAIHDELRAKLALPN